MKVAAHIERFAEIRRMLVEYFAGTVPCRNGTGHLCRGNVLILLDPIFNSLQARSTGQEYLKGIRGENH
jgi:hypothetical protein